MANSDNVFIANPRVAGTFYRAAKGTTLPTDALTALDAGLKDHGYVSEDGYTYSINREVTDHKAFGGDTVASSQDDYNEELTVGLIESLNAEVLRTTFGEANVAVTGDSITVTRNKSVLPRSAFVVDVVGKDGADRRLVLPNAQVVSVGEITMVHTGLITYSLTIKPYPDLAGNTSYEYIELDAAGS